MFTIAALNELSIKSIDIGNAYLNAEAREKCHTTAGKEFGDKAGQPILIVRALYGLKTSGAARHAHCADTLCNMGFTSLLADPDVWYRAASKVNGFAYYEYLLVCVDDILIVSHNPDPIVKCIEQAYRLKEPASDPKHFLGAVIKPWSIPGDSRKIWSMTATKYIEEALRNLKIELDKSGVHLVGKPATPMRTGYRPELDTTALLPPEQANYYMSLIGAL
jgi:hypothetical protein